ncbi:MAG: L,D-transpeptidase family protein [Pseudoxanthomonas sp.]
MKTTVSRTPLHTVRLGHGFWLLAALICVVASACSHTTPTRPQQPWSNARQLVLVVTDDWNADHGVLRTYERTGAGWRETGKQEPVTVGRNGSAWGAGLHTRISTAGPDKREGDGRSPAGVFAIGSAFGYADTSSSALPYQPMQQSDFCMDVSTSPLYNRIVDADEVGAAAVAGSTEPMRLDLHNAGDQRYRLGFVIEHNAAAQAGAGSCIFAHLWKQPGQATAGCTAMADQTMARLLGWLRADAHPVFVLLPRDTYRSLQREWQLPALVTGP